MSTVGIIAEFNPFHNGHAYLINEAKKLTGADHVVIVMSGNYVQRGAPAFMDKFSRTAIALNNNADLVIELPFVYSSASAAYFATGAVNILDKLNVIDYLCFGSENDNLDLISQIADIIINEDDCYSSTLQSYLKNGLSYAKSRENAVMKSLSLMGITVPTNELSTILSSPNSILAIEYIKALKLSNSKIKPVAIKRTDNGYHSSRINDGFASANAIRNIYTKVSVYNFNNIRETMSELVPLNSLEILENNFQKTYPVARNDFSNLIFKALISDKFGLTNLNDLFDTTPNLVNRIRNIYSGHTDIETLINECNSPTYTSTRIARILFYTLMNYTKEDFEKFKNDSYVYYFRILGFKKSHSELLTDIKNNSGLPLITKLSKAGEILSDNGMRMLAVNRLADDIYRMVVSSKFGFEIPAEEEQGVIILN